MGEITLSRVRGTPSPLANPDDLWLVRFVAESNRIEGALSIRPGEVEAHKTFLALERPTIEALEAFVDVVAPGHRLRDREGLNAPVGLYVAPAGGPEIRPALERIIAQRETPYALHVAYKKLRPFTDANGRSGRVLWLWDMLVRGGNGATQARQLGFLHTFYYQSLAAAEG